MKPELNALNVLNKRESVQSIMNVSLHFFATEMVLKQREAIKFNFYLHPRHQGQENEMNDCF